MGEGNYEGRHPTDVEDMKRDIELAKRVQKTLDPLVAYDCCRLDGNCDCEDIMQCKYSERYYLRAHNPPTNP